MFGGGTCKCLWLGGDGVTLSMVERAHHFFNNWYLLGVNFYLIFQCGCTLLASFDHLCKNLSHPLLGLVYGLG
jgi:hypothetical protein